MGLGSQAAGKILDAFDAVQAENETLAAEKAALEEELEDVRRTSAVEKAIWEAGGKNSRAILALVDLSKVRLDGENGFLAEGGFAGLDLEAVKADAPYLFTEKEERTRGTGTTRGQRRRESEISEAFRRGLRR